jgi:signal peptidase II
LKRYIADYAFLFLVAGTVILLDQLTKSWIRANLQLGEIYRPDLWLSDFARIVHWKNTGAAFGMFQSGGMIFTVLSFVVSVVIIYYFPQTPRTDWLIRLAMGLLLGGAVGNLIDRLQQGHVTDFISVGDFPVFNVADSSISLGVVVLFLGMWKQEREARAERARLQTNPAQLEKEHLPPESIVLSPEEDQRG